MSLWGWSITRGAFGPMRPVARVARSSVLAVVVVCIAACTATDPSGSDPSPTSGASMTMSGSPDSRSAEPSGQPGDLPATVTMASCSRTRSPCSDEPVVVVGKVFFLSRCPPPGSSGTTGCTLAGYLTEPDRGSFVASDVNQGIALAEGGTLLIVRRRDESDAHLRGLAGGDRLHRVREPRAAGPRRTRDAVPSARCRAKGHRLLILVRGHDGSEARPAEPPCSTAKFVDNWVDSCPHARCTFRASTRPAAGEVGVAPGARGEGPWADPIPVVRTRVRRRTIALLAGGVILATQAFALGAGAATIDTTYVPQGPRPITGGQVENVTPNNEVAGAVHTIVAHPADADTLWIGTVNGGIWRTIERHVGSPTWTPLTDQQSACRSAPWSSTRPSPPTPACSPASRASARSAGSPGRSTAFC